MRTSLPPHLPSSFLPALLLSASSLLLYPASTGAIPGSDYDYGTHPRFVCTPIPADADPACFPPGGPGMGGSGPSGPGHHGPPGGPPKNGWWGMTEEAKATILHLRENLVQQKETILDQRETIRELTAKLTLCEGLGRSVSAHEEHHGSPPHHGGPSGHPTYPDNGHYGNQQGHHGGSNGQIPPESQNYHGSDGGHSKVPGKDKYATPGDVTSSPEQKERMLQALKDRLENLQQKRNTSTTYSSSLKELLQRKIDTLEQQLHPTAALSSPDHNDDDSSPHDDDDDDDDDADGDDDDHHDDDRDDRHPNDHDDPHDDGHDDRDRNDHHDDSDGHDDAGDHGDSDHGDDHHDIDNEADSHGYLPRGGYLTSGLHSSTKLESMLNQLHLTGSRRKKLKKSPDAFQIGFPMRTNYMYGRVKRTLLHEIFALTLCMWIKGGAGPGLGTPFSYSVPGQANELVLIEWGNNPMEFLIDDKAVTLPLSLDDGKWHHVCVSWSTRDGQWEAYQDGVRRGSGENLASWHPIKPGGVFILGQEQDTLGGRFDATQSFVGEISDLQMWSHVLSASEVSSLASCSSHLSGDVIAWSETEVELHGGVTKYPFDPCH